MERRNSEQAPPRDLTCFPQRTPPPRHTHTLAGTGTLPLPGKGVIPEGAG